jgi:PTS system N-acetylglucosamine-specific IIC component
MEAKKIVEALGGKDNIKNLDSCITRLRITLNDITKLNEKGLKKQGAVAVMKLGGGNIQVIIGTDAEFIEKDIKAVMRDA